jgi:hypothetical protein
MYLLNAKSAIHHLILSKDSSSMENMPATREKVIVGNNKKYTAYTRVTNNNSFFDTYIHK